MRRISWLPAEIWPSFFFVLVFTVILRLIQHSHCVCDTRLGQEITSEVQFGFLPLFMRHDFPTADLQYAYVLQHQQLSGLQETRCILCLSRVCRNLTYCFVSTSYPMASPKHVEGANSHSSPFLFKHKDGSYKQTDLNNSLNVSRCSSVLGYACLNSTPPPSSKGPVTYRRPI